MRNSTALAIVVGMILGSVLPAVAADAPAFRAAKPVWLAGRETEMNVLAGFRATFRAEPGQPATLRLAASCIYRAYINGQFHAHGPARGPHGYYRVDEWDLSKLLRPGDNLLAIEVAGYNVNSFYLLDQPSFLQAEVTSSDTVLAATDAQNSKFAALALPQRLQKVQRYSFQRPFTEAYRLDALWQLWRNEPALRFPVAAIAVQTEKKLLPRRVLSPDFVIRKPLRLIAEGQIKPQAKVDKLWKDRSLTDIGPKLKGYPEKQLELIPSIEMQKLAFTLTPLAQPWQDDQRLALPTNTFRTLDLGTNFTGFIGAKITATKKTRVWFAFDEILSNNDVDSRRLSCVNIVAVDLEPGTYNFESIEPYTLRYLKLLCLDGEAEVSNVYLREYAHPTVATATFTCSDPRLEKLFAAGIETFRQNALDIFMDCPSRERAGWLCDSFFTARVEADLDGVSRIEHNFVENYLLPERFAYLPDGMLPMCYPSDHYDGVFIPNWAMWFLVELEEYAARTNDRATIDALRPRVMKLLAFLKKYENDDGLLEKLPSWVFIEWSKANDFVQDVNYPSNMLYAGALSSIGRLYNEPDLLAKADRIRDTIRKQSFDGQFFVDNALRRGGKLQVTKNRSEVCQYFAVFFDVATPSTHKQLFETLRDRFGPDRQQTKAFPDVHIANSFIGNMLRMEMLSRQGRGQQILDESIAYLMYMADRTGTLWENTGAYASCDHGFASHIVHTLYRDVLGLYQVDRVNKRVQVRFGDLRLDRCEGQIPTPDGPIQLRWKHDGNRLVYRLTLPPGYQSSIDNHSGREIVQE